MQTNLFEAHARRTETSVLAHRQTKREQVEAMFSSHIGQKFSSSYLHATYGSAVRTRISEINKTSQSIRILNDVTWTGKAEESTYWAVIR